MKFILIYTELRASKFDVCSTHLYTMLNQYSPVPRVQLYCWEGRYATALTVRPVGARVAGAQIYAGLGILYHDSNR